MTPIRIPGEKDPDRSQRLGICAELLRDQRPERKLSALFVDTAFGAPVAVGSKNLGFTNVFEVNAGGASPDLHCLNMRAFMWMKGKEWLLLGGLRDDEELASQLALPGYHINSSGKLVIESKKSIQERGEKSPDDADAFLLTFARNVATRVSTSVSDSQQSCEGDQMGLTPLAPKLEEVLQDLRTVPAEQWAAILEPLTEEEGRELLRRMQVELLPMYRWPHSEASRSDRLVM